MAWGSQKPGNWTDRRVMTAGRRTEMPGLEGFVEVEVDRKQVDV